MESVLCSIFPFQAGAIVTNIYISELTDERNQSRHDGVESVIIHLVPDKQNKRGSS